MGGRCIVFVLYFECTLSVFCSFLCGRVSRVLRLIKQDLITMLYRIL